MARLGKVLQSYLVALLLGSVVALTSGSALADSAAAEPLRVGIYTNYPVVFEKAGLPTGFHLELLKAVAKKAGREKEATALLDEILNAAVKTRTQEGRDTVNDFFARTNDPGALDTSRHRISAMIIQMTNTAK